MRTAIDFPPAPDTLILCDIENLAGAAKPTAPDIREIGCQLHRAFSHRRYLEVVACDIHNASRVCFNWPHPARARHRFGRGPDGADRELLGVLRYERVDERFRLVIIGSGDHIFAEPAMRLRSVGIHVVAAVGRGTISKHLRTVVEQVVHLPLLASAN